MLDDGIIINLWIKFIFAVELGAELFLSYLPLRPTFVFNRLWISRVVVG